VALIQRRRFSTHVDSIGGFCLNCGATCELNGIYEPVYSADAVIIPEKIEFIPIEFIAEKDYKNGISDEIFAEYFNAAVRDREKVSSLNKIIT